MVWWVWLQVLAHRLGLIPLNVDPRKFEMMPPCTPLPQVGVVWYGSSFL